MKNLLILIFSFTSITSFSQNKDTYFSWRITEGIYEYFDSLQIDRLEFIDTCDCSFIIETKFAYFTKSENAYDSLLLNEFADEDLLDGLIKDYVKKLKKYGKPQVSCVYIETNIKQIKNTYSIFRLNRKIKYKLNVNIYYIPK